MLPAMDYVGRIFRPPSEARSLLLQITVGCSHNRCAYCDMYRDKRFRPKDMAQIEADIEEAAAAGPQFHRMFLCDGDALILPTKKLLQILDLVQQKLPWIERVGTYGDTRSVGRKSPQELEELRAAGLGIVYHGMESGDDETLIFIDKGGTAAECIDTATKLRDAHIDRVGYEGRRRPPLTPGRMATGMREAAANLQKEALAWPSSCSAATWSRATPTGRER